MSVELPDVEMDTGAKPAVTPVGKPETPSDTVPVKLFSGLTVAENVVAFPAVTFCEAGEADRLKSGLVVFAFTVTLTCVLWISLPLVPVMLRV